MPNKIGGIPPASSSSALTAHAPPSPGTDGCARALSGRRGHDHDH